MLRLDCPLLATPCTTRGLDTPACVYLVLIGIRCCASGVTISFQLAGHQTDRFSKQKSPRLKLNHLPRLIFLSSPILSHIPNAARIKLLFGSDTFQPILRTKQPNETTLCPISSHRRDPLKPQIAITLLPQAISQPSATCAFEAT